MIEKEKFDKEKEKVFRDGEGKLDEWGIFEIKIKRKLRKK